ncbi:MAG: hypothetical protein OH333_04735 [Candidatus Parvarchaeota archaeon]|nr:hypothetical protein [Candidatus Jingweiarchaeum tengchongense]MCW1311053.1 hypothetical protein [Candidatus Jingweiarchaeum tengchongense]
MSKGLALKTLSFLIISICLLTPSHAGFFDSFSNFFNGVVKTVKNIVNTVVNVVINTVANIANTITNTITNTINTITNSISQQNPTNIQTNPKQSTSSQTNNQETIKTDTNPDKITNIINKVRESFTNTINNFVNTVSNTINNFFFSSQTQSNDQNSANEQSKMKITLSNNPNISNFPIAGSSLSNYETPFMYEQGNFSPISSNSFIFNTSTLSTDSNLITLGIQAGIASTCTLGLAYYLHQTQTICNFEDERKKNSIFDSFISYISDIVNFYSYGITHPEETFNSIVGAFSGLGKSIFYDLTHPTETINTFVNSVQRHSTEIIAGIIIGGAITATVLTMGAVGITIPPAITLAAAITGSTLSIHYIGRRYGDTLNEINKNCTFGGENETCEENINEFNEKASVDFTITVGSIGVGKLIERGIIYYSNQGVQINYDTTLSEDEILEANTIYNSELKWMFYKENFKLPKEYKIKGIMFVNSESIIDGMQMDPAISAMVSTDGTIYFNVDRFEDALIPAKDYILRHELGDYKYFHGLTNMVSPDEAMEIFNSMDIPVDKETVRYLIENNLIGDKVAVWNNPKALQEWITFHQDEISNFIAPAIQKWNYLYLNEKEKILSYAAYLQAISEEQGITEFSSTITDLIAKLPKEDVEIFNKLLQFFFTIMKKGVSP